MAKLELYRKFTNYLAVFVLLSIAWIGYEVLILSYFVPKNKCLKNKCFNKFMSWTVGEDLWDVLHS